MNYISDLMVGQIFGYNGGLFVACDFDWCENKYPYLCIATRNPKYLIGSNYYFENDEVATSTISAQHLKSCFIPKDIDFEEE